MPRVTLDLASPTPLWAQLRDALRRRITEGEWPAGAMIPREVDLCEHYGVSRITAARAVQELVREGLLRRQRGRGTAVSSPLPRAGGPAALAFVTPTLDTDWTIEKYGGFEAVVSAAGHFSMLTSTGGGRTLDAARLQALVAARARGLVISQLRLAEDARTVAATLRRDGVPVVFAGTYDPAIEADRVVADNAGAGRVATEHLMGLGHRRIAFLAPEAAAVERSTSLSGRLDGYRAAMGPAASARETGELELLDAVPHGLDDQARMEHLLAFLDRTAATAAVCSTDALAILVTRYLRAAGLRVPEHLALAGISDTRVAAVVEVPLTTVRLNARAMGAEAARVLLRRLEGDTSPLREVILPVELVVRASCGARTGSEASDPYEPAHAVQDASEALLPALER